MDTTKNLAGFITAQSKMESFDPLSIGGRGIYRFAASKTSRIPMHVRTGYTALGSPTERKRFKYVEFHGEGMIHCRVYVDGIIVVDTTVNMDESAFRFRRIGIPTGTRGYAIDLEFSGNAKVRAVEYGYMPMGA